jgi:hypothetical protein
VGGGVTGDWKDLRSEIQVALFPSENAEQEEQDDDRDRNADQPEKAAFEHRNSPSLSCRNNSCHASRFRNCDTFRRSLVERLGWKNAGGWR